MKTTKMRSNLTKYNERTFKPEGLNVMKTHENKNYIPNLYQQTTTPSSFTQADQIIANSAF